jgi:prepilin-type N-terminal cleavage/methylation domain-containing protein
MKKQSLHQKNHKGFTLIELLVVVAIIGILAATTLASLGQARAKARLARAQSELSSMRAAAELYYSTNGSYDIGMFDVGSDGGSGMANLVVSIKKNFTEVYKNANATGWAYAFQAGTDYYCADSNGYSGKTAALQNRRCCM